MKFLLYLIVQLEMLFRYELVYSGVLGIERTKKKFNYRLAVGIVIVISIVSYFYSFEWLDIVALLIINPVIFCLMFSGKKSVRIFTFFPLLLCFNFVDELIAVIAGNVFDFVPIIMAEERFFWINGLIAIPSCIVIGLISIYNNRRQKFFNIQDYMTITGYIIMNVTLFLFVILMSFVSYGYFLADKERVMSRLDDIMLIAISAVVGLLLLIGYMSSLIVAKNIQAELLQAYEKRDSLQKDYYQMLYKKNEEIRDFRHDYRHHIRYLYKQLQNENYDETKKYLKSLVEMGDEVLDKRQIYSENPIIDAIISGVMESKKTKEIRFSYMGKVKRKLDIRDIDLSTVLFNALENAVEACLKCDNKKEINMKIRIYQGNVTIEIDNTHNGKLERKGEKYKTSKEDKISHGRGLQNMKRIAEKYDGSLETDEQNGKFFLKIQLNEMENI